MTDPHSISDRVRRRVERDFPPRHRPTVLRTLGALVPESDARGRERIQAAVLVITKGRPDAIERAAREVEIDWRDVLMAADLGLDDWPARVDAYLNEP